MSGKRARLALLGVALAAGIALVAVAMPAPAPGTVHHVVLIWMKEPGNLEARERLITATRTLQEIPGMVDLAVGAALPSDRATVDDSFDVGIDMTFESADALHAYLQHPLHLQVAAEHLVPLAERYLAYDIVE